MSKELIQIQSIKPLELFTERGADLILKEIKDQVDTFISDISTLEGRKQIKTMSYRIARSKTALDDLGKNLVSDWKAKAKLVDNERKKIRDTLDELRDGIRQPLTDFENAEKERIQTREVRIEAMKDMKTCSIMNSKQVGKFNQTLEDLYKFDWQEFNLKAEIVYKDVNTFFAKTFIICENREEEQKELERLRKIEAEVKQKEREEQIRKEATEIAKQQAESKIEEVEEARKKVEIRAKEQVEEARTEERGKIEAEKQAELERKKAAEEDVKHKARIEGEILLALGDIDLFDGDDVLGQIVQAIARGDIPHLTITY